LWIPEIFWLLVFTHLRPEAIVGKLNYQRFPTTNTDTMKIIMMCLLVSLTISPTQTLAVDTGYLQGLGDTRYHRVESKHIGRGYHVYVMLPSGYDETAGIKYPTIYLLDGGGLYPMLTAYYRYLNFGEEIPAAIIVGISYGSDSFEQGNFRSTDYTAPSEERSFWGGANKFQQFLSDDLFPIVEQAYASDAAHRILFGQSIGGQFVLYSALTRPNMFWGHIASNPALHRNLPFFLKTHIEPGSKRGNSHLFVANGTLNDARFQIPAQKWVQHWSAVATRPWDLKTTELNGHSHMSTPPASFRQGMVWLFAGTKQGN
jgi:predicted alpha/beta superfamily hydrolase